MNGPGPLLVALGVLLLGVAVYYVVAIAAFLRLYYAAMDPSGRRGRWTRKLFPGTAREVEEGRRQVDPGVLARTDARLRRGRYLLLALAILAVGLLVVLVAFLL